MKIFFSKIFLCATHRRFKMLFDRLEREGFRLYVLKDNFEENDYNMRVRRFVKNLGKTVALYEKFTQ